MIECPCADKWFAENDVNCTAYCDKQVLRIDDKTKAPILAVDFDGTIVEHKFPGIGKLIPGARVALRYLHKKGCRIIIWTCRKGKYENNMREFLVKEKIPFDYINENVPGIDFTSNKVFANYYIDDLNLGGFPGWLETTRIVMRDGYFQGEQALNKIQEDDE